MEVLLQIRGGWQRLQLKTVLRAWRIETRVGRCEGLPPLPHPPPILAEGAVTCLGLPACLPDWLPPICESGGLTNCLAGWLGCCRFERGFRVRRWFGRLYWRAACAILARRALERARAHDRWRLLMRGLGSWCRATGRARRGARGTHLLRGGWEQQQQQAKRRGTSGGGSSRAEGGGLAGREQAWSRREAQRAVLRWREWAADERRRGAAWHRAGR